MQFDKLNIPLPAHICGQNGKVKSYPVLVCSMCNPHSTRFPSGDDLMVSQENIDQLLLTQKQKCDNVTLNQHVGESQMNAAVPPDLSRTRTFDILRQRNVPVYFDPTNVEHIRAFQMQCIGEVRTDGTPYYRQHPTLRFVLERPFLDVKTMMMYKIGQEYVRTQLPTV